MVNNAIARVSRMTGVWRSLVAHLLWEQGVGGSNPLTPIPSAGESGSAGVRP